MQLNRVQKIDDRIEIKHALISVADKSRLDRLIQALLSLCPDIELYSTGGTYKFIADLLGPERAEKRLRSISDYTGQPEMQGGLVKTLDFRIYLGLLSETYNSEHQEDLRRTSAIPFDLVVVNLYPFREAVAVPEATLEDGRAHIDIGGPCMLRAAAKNFLRVAAVSDPTDYASLIEELEKNSGALTLEVRYRLAQKIFRATASYDAAVAEFLAAKNGGDFLRIYEKA